MPLENVTAAALRAAELNTQTRELTTYVAHRQRVMHLLGIAAARLADSANPSIAVLGAGNCLDVDLHTLERQFHRIELLDLDRAALEFAVTSQAVAGLCQAGSERIRLIGPFDIASPLVQLSVDDLNNPTQWMQVCESLQAPLSALPCAPCDVVVSTCLLTQLISPLVSLATEQHPNFAAFLQALRRGHFCRMLQLLKPGGQAIFISDLVSSETTPALLQVTDNDLPRLLAHCLSTGNFFSGLNPGLVLQDLQTQPLLNTLARHVQILTPWRWQMGPRTYAVYAITFTKQ
jgi:hypothetical protein